MTGAIQRLIRQQGREYTIRNATDDGSDRSTPDYSDDGTLTGVLERRSRTASIDSLSSGEELESALELRTVLDNQTVREVGEVDYPTKLVHPDGQTYRVLARFPEDSGVTVLSLERA